MKKDEVLALKFKSRDLNKTVTVRQYLFTLLSTLWKDGECFSGKRPFGNSGWEYDLYMPLIKAGVINGDIDEDGYLQDCDSDAGYKVIESLIKHLAKESP